MSAKTFSIQNDASIDRRVRRTRHLLQEAFTGLLSEVPYESITVEQICEAADVGRSTFYSHYPSKRALKTAAIDDRLQAELLKGSAAGCTSCTLSILRHVSEHRHLHRGLSSPAAALAMEAVRQWLLRALAEELGSDHMPNRRQAGAREQFLAGAFMALLLWWLERGAHESPEQIEALFRTLGASARTSDTEVRTTGVDLQAPLL